MDNQYNIQGLLANKKKASVSSWESLGDKHPPLSVRCIRWDITFKSLLWHG